MGSSTSADVPSKKRVTEKEKESEREREREGGGINPHVRAHSLWRCGKTGRVKKKRGHERGWGQREAEWYAEVVFVRATINSASSVLPPKTYRNKYAVRPARGWAAALYSNAVHMEQFITLQHEERKRVRRVSLHAIRATCASLYPPSAIVPILLNYYFVICVLYLATIPRLARATIHVSIERNCDWTMRRVWKNKTKPRYIAVLLPWLKTSMRFSIKIYANMWNLINRSRVKNINPVCKKFNPILSRWINMY